MYTESNVKLSCNALWQKYVLQLCIGLQLHILKLNYYNLN